MVNTTESYLLSSSTYNNTKEFDCVFVVVVYHEIVITYFFGELVHRMITATKGFECIIVCRKNSLARWFKERLQSKGYAFSRKEL